MLLLHLFQVRSKPLLHEWEVNAVLAQALSPRAKDPVTIHALKLDRVDARPVHVATLIMRGISNIYFLLGVCNDTIQMKNVRIPLSLMLKK